MVAQGLQLLFLLVVLVASRGNPGLSVWSSIASSLHNSSTFLLSAQFINITPCLPVFINAFIVPRALYQLHHSCSPKRASRADYASYRNNSLRATTSHLPKPTHNGGGSYGTNTFEQ